VPLQLVIGAACFFKCQSARAVNTANKSVTITAGGGKTQRRKPDPGLGKVD
jgi:hypothetical protein